MNNFLEKITIYVLTNKMKYFYFTIMFSIMIFIVSLSFEQKLTQLIVVENLLLYFFIPLFITNTILFSIIFGLIALLIYYGDKQK